MSSPIITLTTVPPRFDHLGPTLESLRAQSVQAAHILVFVPQRYRRFAGWSGSDLPSVPKGVEIVRCPRDYGPATKVLAAVRGLQDPDTPIIFADDDVCYPADFAERLLTSAATRPDMAITLAGRDVPIKGRRVPMPRARARPERADWRFRAGQYVSRATRVERWAMARRPFRSDGHVDVFLDGAGGLVRPRFFDGRAFAIPNLLWELDTIWLSGILAARGVPIWLSANAPAVRLTEASAEAPLWDQGAVATRARSERDAFDYMRRCFGAWR